MIDVVACYIVSQHFGWAVLTLSDFVAERKAMRIMIFVVPGTMKLVNALFNYSTI